MILDDPMQAMDVLSVLGFADLCRRIRSERQLIITTHDRRFADLLSRKLAPRGDGQPASFTRSRAGPPPGRRLKPWLLRRFLLSPF